MPNRRWFQFSLRTFLVLLTVIGVWLGLHVRSAERQREAVAAFKGAVYYDFQQNDLKAQSWVPQWLLSTLGLDFFHDVHSVQLLLHVTYNDGSEKVSDTSHLSADVIRHLDALTDLRSLTLNRSQHITDDDMTMIGGLRKLEYLRIGGASGITDAGTSCLKNLSHLKHLYLSDPCITDESFVTFSQLPRLETLSLRGDPILDGIRSRLRQSNERGMPPSGSGDNQVTIETVVTGEGVIHMEFPFNSTITAKGLEQLAALKNLKEITVGRDVGDLSRVRQLMPHCQFK